MLTGASVVKQLVMLWGVLVMSTRGPADTAAQCHAGTPDTSICRGLLQNKQISLYHCGYSDTLTSLFHGQTKLYPACGQTCNMHEVLLKLYIGI